MGKLLDFLGGFGGSLGQQWQQQRQMADEEEEEARRAKRQLDYVRAAEAIRTNMKTKTDIPVPSPYGSPIQRGPGNWEQPTKIARGALLDETTGEVVRAPALEDGPFMPTTDPNALTPYQAETIAQRDRAAQARVDAAKARGGSRGGSSRAPIGEDGLTPDQRADNARADAREERLRNQRGGSGGTTEKGWREGFDQTTNSIQNADAGKLKSIIRQYGGDNIITADMDEDMLRESAYAVAETYWNERKPSNKPKSDDKAAPDKPDEKAVSFAEADAQVAAKRPDLTPAQRRQYLAGKGIRP